MGNIRVRNQVGKQGAVSKALEVYALAVGDELQMQQVDKEFIATGKTLDQYVVLVEPRNRVSLMVPEYYHTFVEDFGRLPGTFPNIGEIAKWIEVKGIKPEKGQTINQLASAMSVYMMYFGNQVFRGEREGINVEESINDAWDVCKHKIGMLIAEESADLMLKSFYKSVKK